MKGGAAPANDRKVDVGMLNDLPGDRGKQRVSAAAWLARP